MIHGGFSVNGVHTSDLGFCLASRELAAPTKKTVRVTIPFMNGSYDFTELYGRPYFEDRELTYVLDAIADSPRELEIKMRNLREFLAYITEQEIYDDDIPGYHFKGSISAIETEYEESGLSAEVTATFLVYPFAIANKERTASITVGNNIVVNNGYAARITVVPNGTCTIQIGSLRQTFSGETVADILLERGENTVIVTNGSATIKWSEERL